jgi:hypothetical protein
MAQAAGVADPQATWRLAQAPTFDNQLAVLCLDGRRAHLRIERTHAGDGRDPRLEATLDRDLA